LLVVLDDIGLNTGLQLTSTQETIAQLEQKHTDERRALRQQHTAELAEQASALEFQHEAALGLVEWVCLVVYTSLYTPLQ
jgi:hypothetical protein